MALGNPQPSANVGVSISSGSSGQAPYAKREYREGQSRAPGDTQAFIDATNRVAARQANQQQGSTYGQLANAYNYYGNLYGINPNTGMSANFESQAGRLGLDAYGQRTGGGELGFIDFNRDYMGNILREDTNAALQRLGLQQQELGIDKAALNRRLGSGGYFDQLGGLIGRNLTNQLAGVDLQDLTAGHMRETQRRGEISDATARGALQTVGTRADLHDIDKELMRQLRSGQLSREGYRIGADKERVSLAEQRAQDKDRQGALDIRAKDYGMQSAEYKRQLQRGLEKLGIDAYLSVEDVMDKFNSAATEDRMLAAQIEEQVRNTFGNFNSYMGTSGTPATQRQTVPGSRRTPLR